MIFLILILIFSPDDYGKETVLSLKTGPFETFLECKEHSSSLLETSKVKRDSYLEYCLYEGEQ